MDTNFGNENNTDNSVPEPIVEPSVNQHVDNNNDPDSDNHFDDANVMNLNTPGNRVEKKILTEKGKKPDPKVLADSFKQTLEIEKSKSNKGQNQYIYYLLIFVIIFVGLLFIRQLSLQRQINELKTNLDVTIVPAEASTTVTPTGTTRINVIEPEEFQEISGEVGLQLEVESISKLSLKIFDDNGVELGGLLNSDIELVNNIAEIEEVINITKSPTVSVGYLIVYPADDNINSPVSKTVSVKFPKSTVVNRINVIGPVKNQLINSTELNFTGDLKGFKNNTIGIRVLDSTGKVYFESEIKSVTDKASQDFVKFSQTVEIGTFNYTTETGSVEFYDISDSNKTSILSIPVRFK